MHLPQITGRCNTENFAAEVDNRRGRDPKGATQLIMIIVRSRSSRRVCRSGLDTVTTTDVNVKMGSRNVLHFVEIKYYTTGALEMSLSLTRCVAFLPWKIVMVEDHAASRPSWNPLSRPLLVLRAIVDAPVKL